MGKAQAKKGVSVGVIVIIGCVLLAVIAVLAVLLLKKDDAQVSAKANRDPNADLGQIEGKTQEEIQAELNKIVEDGMFNISINSDITFENGSSEGDVRIENIAANRLLMSVAIILDDTGETVYECGILEPGYHIQTAKLTVPLVKGVYPATAMFTAYEPDTEAVVGQAGAKVVLTVKN